MIILDTDHLSILQHPESPQFERLTARMAASSDQNFATTAISLEEQTRGWLAAINRAGNAHRQVVYYARLTGLVRFYSQWIVLPFDETAADGFEALRRHHICIGTMDLKISSIALATHSLLLSANLEDFEKVPALQIEDWLH